MKTISILIVFLLISLNLFSQKVQYSIEAGGNYNISSNNTMFNSVGEFGFNLGNKFTIPLNKHFSIKTGFGLNQLKGNINSDIFDFPYFSLNYNLLSLNIPLQLQINFLKKRLLLTTGFSASTIIYAKSEARLDDGSYIEYNAKDDFKNFFLNMNIGIEYKIQKNTYLGIFYERSNNIIKNQNLFIDLNPQVTYGGDLEKNSNTYLNNLSLNLSYKF